MSVHVRNIGWSIVGPSPSSLAVLVVMSSDVNGPLFFHKFHIHITYMINIIYKMVEIGFRQYTYHTHTQSLMSTTRSMIYVVSIKRRLMLMRVRNHLLLMIRNILYSHYKIINHYKINRFFYNII